MFRFISQFRYCKITHTCFPIDIPIDAKVKEVENIIPKANLIAKSKKVYSNL